MHQPLGDGGGLEVLAARYGHDVKALDQVGQSLTEDSCSWCLQDVLCWVPVRMICAAGSAVIRLAQGLKRFALWAKPSSCNITRRLLLFCADKLLLWYHCLQVFWHILTKLAYYRELTLRIDHMAAKGLLDPAALAAAAAAAGVRFLAGTAPTSRRGLSVAGHIYPALLSQLAGLHIGCILRPVS
jgi:hypothetical protein